MKKYGYVIRKNNILWVQGEDEAKSYPVIPGEAVMMFDRENNKIYIKTVDAFGRTLPLKVFTYPNF